MSLNHTYIDAEIVEKLQRRHICASRTAHVIGVSVLSDINTHTPHKHDEFNG